MKKKYGMSLLLSLCMLTLASCAFNSSNEPSVNVSSSESSNPIPSSESTSIAPPTSSSSSAEPIKKITKIELTAEKTTFIEGETLQLIATITPVDAANKVLKYTSSNDEIATVNDAGLVTAKKAGEVTITATSTDGSNVSGTIALVVEKRIVLIDTITLTTENGQKEVEEGYRLKLVTTYAPTNADDTAIDITSSDTNVAKIINENGTYYVEGIKEGTATITASSHDAGDAEASLEITVTKKVILVSSLTLSADKTELYVGETTTVSVAVLPDDATDKTYTLTSSDETIATVDQSGLITAKKAGEVTITATSTDKAAAGTLKLLIKDKGINYVSNLLKQSAEIELEQSSSGTYAINNTDYNWTTYSDDTTQINASISGEEISKTLYSQEGNAIYELTLTEGTSSSISKSSIGTIGEELDQDDAKGYLNSFTLDGVSTVSTIALNYLTSSYFSNKSIIYSNEETTDNNIYQGKTSYDDEALKQHYENAYKLTFDQAGKLLAFTLSIDIYDETSYNFETHTLNPEATKSDKSIAVSAAVKYETRVASDENKLDESDYIATDFEIITDSESWHPNNTLYVGDKAPVEVRVTAPELHLPMTFTIDEETGIDNQSIVQLSNKNGIYYLTAMKAGSTTLTVTGQYGLEKTITINVTEVLPEAIEIRANSLTEIEENTSQDYFIDVAPYDVVDKTFTAEFTDQSMNQYADLSVDCDLMKFTLTAKEVDEDTPVTVVVKSTVDPSIQDEITITIKNVEEVPSSPLEEFKASLVGNRYNYASLNDLYLTSTTEGRLELYGGNVYTFNWDVIEVEGFTDYRLVFTNVVLSEDGGGYYTFTDGNDPSYEQRPQEGFTSTIAKDGSYAYICYLNNSDTMRNQFKLKK